MYDGWREYYEWSDGWLNIADEHHHSRPEMYDTFEEKDFEVPGWKSKSCERRKK